MISALPLPPAQRPLAITLVDIDDTLLQTRRKCPPDLPDSSLTAMAFAADGSPLGFATPAQMALIEWLATSTIFIPVTARSSDALLRTRLPFSAAVAAHGGVIYPGPRAATAAPPVDAGWQARMAATLDPHAAALAQLADRIGADATATGARIRARIIGEDGLQLYLVVKHACDTPDIAELHAACQPAINTLPAGWTAHVNGNNVALMPPGLGKEHAVAAMLPGLRAAWPGLPAIGIGDSLTDGGFMALCDFAMLPSHSQLAQQLFGRPAQP
jgi:hypothetical protein